MEKQSAKDKARAVLSVIDNWLNYKTYIDEIPSVSVGIFMEDETIFQKSYGFMNLETRKKATSKTMYRIASHSKLFTATTMMRLLNEGKLRLDDPVVKYLDWFHSKKDPNLAYVTLRQLLTHSSGLVRDGNTRHWGDEVFPDEKKVIEQVQAGVTIQPGYEHWKYSNFGFTILGLVIEAVTGKSYEDSVMDLVVKPLGMTRSYPDILDKHIKHHATGYGKYFPGEGRAVLPHISARRMNSATGFSSTVEDLIKFYRGHLLGDETLLSDRAKREMQRVQYKDNMYEWGIGFGLAKIGRWAFAGHGGGYKGFITSSALNQEHKLIIVVLTNTVDGPAHFLREGIANLLQTAVLGFDKFTPKKKITAKTMEAITGFYQTDWGINYFGDMNGKLVGIFPDALNPAEELEYYDHLGKLRFKQPMLKNQNTTYGEEFYFNMTQNGRVNKVIFPASLAKPFKFKL